MLEACRDGSKEKDAEISALNAELEHYRSVAEKDGAEIAVSELYKAKVEIEQLNVELAKLRELAEKVATAGYYTHPLAGAIDELRNYLKEVK